jgi:hypothetical protein
LQKLPARWVGKREPFSCRPLGREENVSDPLLLWMAMLWVLGEEEASDPLLLWLAMDELKVDRMEEPKAHDTTCKLRLQGLGDLFTQGAMY